jgi:hypothetical protein
MLALVTASQIASASASRLLQDRPTIDIGEAMVVVPETSKAAPEYRTGLMGLRTESLKSEHGYSKLSTRD